MILLIGRQSRRDKTGFSPPLCVRAGFTFIELLLTTSIILIIIGLSTPIFRRTYYNLRANLQTKDLASLMNLAREKAIMTRVPHAITLDADKNTYRMLAMDLKENKLVAIEGKWGRRFTLSGNLKIDSSRELIKFFSDGSSNGANISFEDASGWKGQVKVDAGTGEIIFGAEEEK